MKKNSFTLKIENPCQENWGKMHSNPSGKFCDSCQKNVVDFTNKTPREIATALHDSREKSCGRFTANQLEEVYSITSPGKVATKWYQNIAASFLVLLGAKNAEAQDSIVKKQEIHSTIQQEEVLIGDTVFVEKTNKKEELIINGRLLDKSTGEPISFNKVYLGNRQSGTISDVDGNFQIKFSRTQLKDTIQLTFGNGYEFEEEKRSFTIDKFQGKEILNIEVSLTPLDSRIVGEIIVSEPKSKRKKLRKNRN